LENVHKVTPDECTYKRAKEEGQGGLDSLGEMENVSVENDSTDDNPNPNPNPNPNDNIIKNNKKNSNPASIPNTSTNTNPKKITGGKRKEIKEKIDTELSAAPVRRARMRSSNSNDDVKGKCKS
jgi:hypothetical protein